MPFISNNILCLDGFNTDELSRGVHPACVPYYAKISHVLKTQEYKQSLLSINKERILIVKEFSLIDIKEYGYPVKSMLQIITSPRKYNTRTILMIESSIAVPEPYDQGGHFITESKREFYFDWLDERFCFTIRGDRRDENVKILACGKIIAGSAEEKKTECLLDFFKNAKIKR